MRTAWAMAAAAALVMATPPRAAADEGARAAAEEGAPAGADAAPRTGLRWARAPGGAAVEVTATRGGEALEVAQREVGAAAARLDALRTVTPHVRWTRLEWRDGRLEVDAMAESAVYANVAILALRRLFPGRASAGSGVQAVRVGDGARWPWRARIRLAPPPEQGGAPAAPER